MVCTRRNLARIAGAFLLLSASSSFAAPVKGVFTYHQPDGVAFPVNVEGDEFYATEETQDGHLIIQDPGTKYWCYARLSKDGTTLESTGVPATQSLASNIDPAASASVIAAAKHLRAPRDHRLRIDRANRLLLHRDADGRILAAGPLNVPGGPFAAAGSVQSAANPVQGIKKGLTLLVQFPDRLADVTIARSQVDAFCNQMTPHYTEFGNNGSVSEFYYQVSGGRLSYTNVVTAYYTARHTRDYYTDESISYGARAAELIGEALDSLEASGFDFRTADGNGDGTIDALNCFYAGDIVNSWARGLWPHASGVYWRSARTGVVSQAYQITDIGASLTLGTFCHENGHMLCGFPDVYDYGYDSTGGGGSFDLMAFGIFGTNPAPPDAYLRYKAGWGTAESIVGSVSHQVSLTAEREDGSLLNQFLIYRRPAVDSEYYVIENLYQHNRGANLPAGGVAIWHVDELGNHDLQNYTHQSSHNNFEVALIQADNLRELERNLSYGDANDLYFVGNLASSYRNEFSDASDAGLYDNNAHWWDGSSSGLRVSAFSVPGNVMTFRVDGALDSGTLALASGTYSVSETAGSVALTVLRSGGSAGAASVHYATSGGTAKAGTDYTAVSGTLNWGNGETGARTILVPILNNPLVTGSQTVEIQLSAASGATLGSPATAILTILDSSEPCVPSATVCGGQSGSFNTSGAYCFRTPDAIQGWGCSNMTGRTVQVNGVVETCGNLPLPVKYNGYYYFSASAGGPTYSSIYWWGTPGNCSGGSR
jgi:M6 family metalloprotease-like protein